MTREEAIQILSTRDAHGVLCGYTSGVTEALDMAIEALSSDAIARAYNQGFVEGSVNATVNSNYVCPRCGEKMERKITIETNTEPLISCKDCKWYDNRYGEVCHNPRYGDGWANYPPPYVDEEHFCKDGERRE